MEVRTMNEAALDAVIRRLKHLERQNRWWKGVAVKCPSLFSGFVVLSLGFSLYTAIAFAQDGQRDEWITFKGTATLGDIGFLFLAWFRWWCSGHI
jgi:hypothetical protein